MKRRTLLTAGLVAAASSLVTACGTPPRTSGGFVGGDGALTRVPVAERKPAPHITGELLTGGQFDSATLAGTVIVYNVWGSWCAPCRKEAPALVEASQKAGDKATFVGINIRDLDKAPAEAFVRAFNVPYDNIYDPDGRLLLAFANDLPASAIPSTLIVDAHGRVAARVLGETTSATLTGLVDDLAKEQ